jgi:hypothetical protein
MEKIEVKQRPELNTKITPKTPPANFSLQQLQDRATAKTEVLRTILGQRSAGSCSHWRMTE